MRKTMEKLLIWLKGLFGLQSSSDLFYLLLNRLITPDIQELLITLIKEAGQQDITGAEKKEYVMTRLNELKKRMLINFTGIGSDTLSSAINLIVEYLKADGQLK